MISKAKTSPFLMIRPIALASAFSLAIVALCCRGDNAFMLYFDIYGMMDELILAYGIGVLLCCAAVVILPTDSHRSRIIWSIVSTALCMAGVLEVLYGNPDAISNIAIASGFTLGAGSVGLLAQWSTIIAKLPERIVPLTIALSFLIATILWAFLRFANSLAPTCVGLLIFILCSGLLLVISSVAERHLKRTLDDMGVKPPERPTSQTFEQQSFERELFEQGTLSSAGEGDNLASPRKPIAVRPALFSIDSLSFNQGGHINGAHVFEALGALFLPFFMLGVMYWPDAVEIEQGMAMLKPISYAIASVIVFFVTAQGSVASLASGGVGHIRRIVVIACALVALMTITVMPAEGIILPITLRIVNNISLAVLTIFGITTTFSSVLHHDPSPTFACAIIVFCCGVGMAFGMCAFFFLGSSAYFIAACVAGVYLMGMVVFASLATPPALS